MSKMKKLYIILTAINVLLFAIAAVFNIWNTNYIMNIIEETPYAIRADNRITIQRYRDFELYETIPQSKKPIIMPQYRKGMSFKNGAVSTASEACLIAEAVWHAYYGYGYYSYKIEEVRLVNDKFWMVKAYAGLGVKTIEIRKSDGKILRNIAER